jgi:hypothetical protein
MLDELTTHLIQHIAQPSHLITTLLSTSYITYTQI